MVKFYEKIKIEGDVTKNLCKLSLIMGFGKHGDITF